MLQGRSHDVPGGYRLVVLRRLCPHPLSHILVDRRSRGHFGIIALFRDNLQGESKTPLSPFQPPIIN